MRAPNFFRRFPAAYHWVRARSAYRRDEIKEALAHYSRARALADNRPGPLYEAFYAHLLVLDRRSPEAREVLAEVIERLSSLPSPTEDERYILYHSRFFAALIDKVEAETYRIAAEETSPDARIARTLPLPPKEWHAEWSAFNASTRASSHTDG